MKIIVKACNRRRLSSRHHGECRPVAERATLFGPPDIIVSSTLWHDEYGRKTPCIPFQLFAAELLRGNLVK